MKRVVVTGMGLISPIGNSVEEFWENVKKKTVGIAPLLSINSLIKPVSACKRSETIAIISMRAL